MITFQRILKDSNKLSLVCGRAYARTTRRCINSKAGEKYRSVLVAFALCFLAVVGLGYFNRQTVYGASSLSGLMDFEAGQKIFQASCSACHPQGGNIINPHLPLRNAPQLGDLNAFIAFIRNPHNPDGSRGMMPAFSAPRISDEQGKQLYEYIIANVLSTPERR